MPKTVDADFEGHSETSNNRVIELSSSEESNSESGQDENYRPRKSRKKSTKRRPKNGE